MAIFLTVVAWSRGWRALAATLVVAVTLALAAGPGADDADAALRDSDGYVPVYYKCGISGLGTYRYSYNYYYSGGRYYFYNVRGAIYLDYCQIRRYGGYNWRQDLNRVYRHEVAHSRGLDHYQGSPRYNAAYYPSLRI